MRNFLTALVLTALISFTPSLLRADAVLLISSGDSTDDAMLKSVLTAQGDTVTIGPTYNNFTGGSLSGYRDVLLVPNGSSPNLGDMPATGQEALLKYVSSGGGLVTGEWVTEMTAAQRDFQILNAALPVVSSSILTNNGSITFSKLTNDPVMNANLPNSFTFQAATGLGGPTEAYGIPKAGATTFFSTSQVASTVDGVPSASGVVGWNYGLGRVVSFATTLDSTSLGSPNFAHLVDNAVNWARNDLIPPINMGPNPPIYLGPFTPAPEPATLVAWGAGILGLVAASYVRRHRGRA